MTGLETRILRALPEIFLAGTAPAALCALLAPDPLASILALAFAVSYALILVPLALACFILSVMKGPMRRADSYYFTRFPSES